MSSPLSRLEQAASNPRHLARKAMKDPRILEELTRGLNAGQARIKYGCAKALRFICEERPELLYPKFDFFVRLLDHENKVFQWQAAFVLSHLARADVEDKFTAVLDRYFSPIPGPVMITAANVIQGGARIARAKPRWADRISGEILKVGRARYQTPECRNVAIGHAVVAFGEMIDLLKDPAPVVSFVKRQLRNSRPATRKKAEQFLKRLQDRAQNSKA